MADLEQRPKVELEVARKLNEAEVRALAALTEYGTDAFLKVFYAQLGSFLKPHEAGIRSLFKGINTHLPAIIRRADAARAAFIKGVEPNIRD
jgi:hypothetical protein